MKVIINKAGGIGEIRSIDTVCSLSNLIAVRWTGREREKGVERRGERCFSILLNEFREGGWKNTERHGLKIALPRKYIFLRSVTAPSYQGREAAQGGNCQLTVINSLSQVAVIKPAISPSSVKIGLNDPGDRFPANRTPWKHDSVISSGPFINLHIPGAV